MIDYAGEFLRKYEGERYSFLERFFPSILVPLGAEEFPDESFWGGEINFDKFSKARGAIFRLGQGTVKDKQFERNYSEAKAHGMAVGAYHFYDGRASPAAQAQFVVETLRGKTLEMGFIADWERNYGAYDGLRNVVAFMRGVEGRVAAKEIGLYTGYYWFREQSNPIHNAAEYDYLRNKPLWLAWYASAAWVKTPPPWTDWTHWQYGTPARGAEFGVQKLEIDMNRHNGTRAEFEQRYLGEVIAPPRVKTIKIEITGDAVYKITEE